MIITIPDLGYDPLIVEINGKRQSFKVGETYDVSEYVKSLIDDIIYARPREDYRVYEKRVLTRNNAKISWDEYTGERQIEVSGLTIIRISDPLITLGDIKNILNDIKGEDPVMFDVRDLNAGGFICTIGMDNYTNPSAYYLFDIRGLIADGAYSSSALLTSVIGDAQEVAGRAEAEGVLNTDEDGYFYVLMDEEE